MNLKYTDVNFPRIGDDLTIIVIGNREVIAKQQLFSIREHFFDYSTGSIQFR